MERYILLSERKVHRLFLKTHGQYSVFEKPSSVQINNLLSVLKGRKVTNRLRGIFDAISNSIYLWDAFFATHTDIYKELGIDANKMVSFYYDGKRVEIKSEYYDPDKEYDWEKIIAKRLT